MILSDGSSEVEQRWGATAKKAMSDIGWSTTVTDGKGDPAVWTQAIQAFTQQKVQGIITVALDAAPITPALKAAKDAGIPVIATGISVSPQGRDLFSAFYAPGDDQFGKTTADYLKTKFPSGTEYTQLDLTAVYGAHEPIVSATPILKDAGFKLVGTHDISTAGIVASATKGSADLATAHPAAKFMFGCCDFTPAITVPALKASGHPTVVQTARYDNLSSLKLIRDGAPVVVVAANADTGVLTALDQILAHTGKKSDVDPKADAGKYKYAVIDKKNVPAQGKFFYPPATQISEFVTKWKSEYGL